jgi:hypothetical protein
MENEELKEKLLCVVKRHADSFVKDIGSYINDDINVSYGRYYNSLISLIFNVYPCYYIKYEETLIYITKEEYEEIIKIREEKIKEKQLKELEKLCNKEQN